MTGDGGVSRDRFIDLARHGGCSKKLNALRLGELLNGLGLEDPWADAPTITAGTEVLASTVDVVLPMIDDPGVFGEIVVAHVLSDLYAIGAQPLFAMNILGVPPDSPAADGPVREMLESAASRLRAAGAQLLGGHSIESDELFYGMAAIGRAPAHPRSQAGARPGDQLVITKPLGTSVATMAWRAHVGRGHEFRDVAEGMRALNRTASAVLSEIGATACTDVTGFGFAGHLHNLLRASGVAAIVGMGRLPRYASTVSAASSAEGTRLLDSNEDYVLASVEWQGTTTPDRDARLYVFDAQVSGGLLATVPEQRVADLQALAEANGQAMWVVGQIEPGPAGQVVFS